MQKQTVKEFVLTHKKETALVIIGSAALATGLIFTFKAGYEHGLTVTEMIKGGERLGIKKEAVNYFLDEIKNNGPKVYTLNKPCGSIEKWEFSAKLIEKIGECAKCSGH